MTITVSPILQNHFNNKADNKKLNAHHEKLYEDLKQHANEVKPNEAKAKLVKRGPVRDTIAAIGDNINDGKNFFTAVKTGKMNDNSLGRINDLGMKFGAVLIASFLAATQAKTKTETLMKFIGGGAFFASMSLWPKIFINLPARIIHGFPIDEKYISAQGDKKDLYLDNQFIPTGIHSKEQKLREMKRMGIDPNEPNAEEKWFRKRQKTALQNRTLWMATAGFATPLMTALFCDFAEPKIQNAIIDHNFKKAKNILLDNNQLNEFLLKQTNTTNKKGIQSLFAEFAGKDLNDEFYKKLSGLLEISDIFDKFKDQNDRTVLQELKSNELIEALKAMREETGELNIEDLKEKLGKIKVATSKGLQVGAKKQGLDTDTIEEIISELGNEKTPKKLREILNRRQIGRPQIDELMPTLKVDNEPFFKTVINYNDNILSKIRGRIKAYLGLLNPIAGSKAESVYTRQYSNIMQHIFKALGLDDYKELKRMKSQGLETTVDILQSKIAEIVEQKDKEYASKLQDFIDITAKYLQSGKKDPESFKNGLRNAFGDNFPLLKNQGQLDEFMTFIKSDATGTKVDPENLTWLMQIMEDYSKNVKEAPKRASIEILCPINLKNEEIAASKKLFDTSTIMKLFSVHTDDKEAFKKIDALSSAITAFIDSKDKNDTVKQKLKEALQKVLGQNADVANAGFENFATHIKEGNYVWIDELIKGSNANQALTHEILGGKEKPSHLFNMLREYMRFKDADINFTRLRPLICANFEFRYQKGMFAGFSEEEIKAARNLIYNGNIALINNKLSLPYEENARNILNAIFNPEVFKSETATAENIADVIGELKTIINQPYDTNVKAVKANSFADQVKNHATKLFNNKSWKKIFIPMAIGLVAVTLLVQPLFGNIKKEYSQNKKTGGAK